jgi:hypothetical protein
LSNRFTSKNPSTPQGKRGRLRKKEAVDVHHLEHYLKSYISEGSIIGFIRRRNLDAVYV